MRSAKHGGFERYLVELARQCRTHDRRLVLQYNAPPQSSSYLSALRHEGCVVELESLEGGGLPAAWRAVRLIARRRPEVVHLHFCDGTTRLAIGLVAHALGVRRTVATVHYLPDSGSGARLRASYARLDRVLCVSRSVEARLVRLGLRRSNLRTHYLGVPDMDPVASGVRAEVREQLAIPLDAAVVCTVVFNSPVKGIDVLVDAFVDHLAGAFKDLHLLVVGVPSSECARFAPRADSMPERMHWVGIHDDVRPFLAASDVYVQPSRSEALGLAIIEAMRQSLPVVATRVGGIPETVSDGESGLLVPPESPEALGLAVGRLLRDPDLAARLARHGHARWHQRFRLAGSVSSLVRDFYEL